MMLDGENYTSSIIGIPVFWANLISRNVEIEYKNTVSNKAITLCRNGLN